MARLVLEIDGDSSGVREALDTATTEIELFEDATRDASSGAAGLEGKLDGLAVSVEETGKELDRTTDRTERMREQLEETSKSTGRAGTSLTQMAGSLGRVALVGGAAYAGFRLLSGGARMVWESVERMFRATEDGQQIWEDVERRAFALRGRLAELVIGTDDQTEAAERLHAMFDQLDRVSGAVVRGLTPLAALLRGGLTVGLRTAAAAAAVFTGEMGSAEAQLYQLAQQANDTAAALSDDLRATLAGIAGEDPAAAIARQREQIAEVAARAALGRATNSGVMTMDQYRASVTQANAALLEQGRIQLQQDRVLNGQVIRSTRDASLGTDAYADAMEQLRERVVEAIIAGEDLSQTFSASVLRDARDGTGSLIRTTVELSNVYELLGSRTFELEGDTITYAAALRLLGEAEDTAAGRGREVADVRREQRVQTEQLSDALRKLKEQAEAAYASELAILQALQVKRKEQAEERFAAESEARAAAEEMARLAAERQAESEREQLDKRKALLNQMLEAEAEAERRREQQAIESLARREAAFGQFAGTAADALASVAAGQASSEEAAKAFSGSILDSLADVALAQAGMRFFQPELGGPPAALALIAAAVAAKATARRLGASGGGGNGPSAPPPEASQPTVNNSYQLVLNGGGFMDPRRAARELGPILDEVFSGSYSGALGRYGA